ncbi:MAG: hypothetical protein LLG97_09350 [Deltaproteobacteria bacterium]|nr:hypothetical protein [Deltaproteobacteria bacterium]
MKRIIFGAIAVLLLVLWQTFPLSAAATKSSCLTCHTNDAMMKALHKPPKIESGRAEG